MCLHQLRSQKKTFEKFLAEHSRWQQRLAAALVLKLGAVFGLKVALEPYRKEEKTTLGRGFCALPTPSASSAGWLATVEVAACCPGAARSAASRRFAANGFGSF